LISLPIQPSPCLIQTSSARGSSINGSATGSNYQADTRYHIGSYLNIFLKKYLSGFAVLRTVRDATELPDSWKLRYALARQIHLCFVGVGIVLRNFFDWA
jgi:hypothetical protein